MASIYKRGNTYTAQFVVNGSRRQFALGTSSKRQALTLLAKLETAHERGLWDPLSQRADVVLKPLANGQGRGRPSALEGQIEAFLESRRSLSPRSQQTYRQVLSLFMREGSDLRQFLARRRGVTRLKYYRHLRVFYKWQVKQGWISRNPCDDIALPRRPQKEATFFTREQIGQLVSCIQTNASLREVAYLPQMVEFVCYTGLRLSEVCALKWADVDGDQLVLRRTKSGREERVSPVPRASEILETVERTAESVFCCPQPGQVSKRFLYWRRKSGLKAGSFHSLRHTCAAWMAMSGASAYVIMRHLRHSSITVTQRYMGLLCVHRSPSGGDHGWDRPFRWGARLRRWWRHVRQDYVDRHLLDRWYALVGRFA